MSNKKPTLPANYDFRAYRDLTAYTEALACDRGIDKTSARRLAYEAIPLEQKYQSKILAALCAEFPTGRWRKVAQGCASRCGEPDLDGVLNGKYIAVEVKRPLLGNPTKLQLRAVREIRRAGGCAMIASYPDEVVAAVKCYMQGLPYWYELTGCTAAVAESAEECLE